MESTLLKDNLLEILKENKNTNQKPHNFLYPMTRWICIWLQAGRWLKVSFSWACLWLKTEERDVQGSVVTRQRSPAKDRLPLPEAAPGPSHTCEVDPICHPLAYAAAASLSPVLPVIC